MGFTSFGFFLFVPVVLVGFAVFPGRWRLAWLLAASVIFYGTYGLESFLHLVFVVLLAHSVARRIEGARNEATGRRFLHLGVVVLIGALGFSKFGDFALAEVARLTGGPLLQTGLTPPPGFSFYIFMAVAYIVDVWRGQVGATSLAQTALHLSWFPKILAGPIERAETILPQIGNAMRASPVQTALGLQLFLWGLVKKVVIADNLAPVVNRTFEIPAYAPPMEILISLYFFAFQLYCDFSGYSDMAIGLSLLFGIALRENFRRPYLAMTTTEFWSRRWHISLANWFRDYLFYPLCGSQPAAVRQHMALLTVFAASGLWHAGQGYGVGWAFLVWGLLNGIYLSVEKMLRPAGRRLARRYPRTIGNPVVSILRVLLTFHLVLITWAFFRADTIDNAVLVLRRIAEALPELATLVFRYPYSADHVLGAALIVALLTVEAVAERRPFIERMGAWPSAARWAVWLAGFAALLLLGRWGDATFIYQGF